MTTVEHPPGLVRRARFRNRRTREALQAYAFLLPGTFILLAFSLLPVLYAFIISLHRWRIRQRRFLWFDNYLKALGTPLDILLVIGGIGLLAGAWAVWRKIARESPGRAATFRGVAALMLLLGGVALAIGIPKMLADGDENLFKSLLNTFFYSLGTVPAQIVLSFLLANILFQNIRGKSFWRMVYFLPYVTVTVASAAVWTSIFEPRRGLANVLLSSLGVQEDGLPQWLFEASGIGSLIGDRLGIAVPSWASGPSLALISVIIYNIWTYVGYNTVIYLAGLGTIPGELYEAARIDGAGRWELLRHVTIPLVSPTTYFLVMMGILGTFRAFNHIYVLTNIVGPVGSPQGTTLTASMLIWKNFREGNRSGYASALAFVLAGIMLGLSWIQNRIAERRVFYG